MRFFTFVAVIATAVTTVTEAARITRNEYDYAQLETVAQPPDAVYRPPPGVPSYADDPNHPYWKDYSDADSYELRKATKKYLGKSGSGDSNRPFGGVKVMF